MAWRRPCPSGGKELVRACSATRPAVSTAVVVVVVLERGVLRRKKSSCFEEKKKENTREGRWYR
eukprot:3937976-Rhodomonas_salina.1